MTMVPGRISLQLYDTKGGGGTALAHVAVSDASTLAAANTAVGTFATAFSTLSDAGIKEGTFTLLTKAVAAAPASDVEIGVGAVFDFSNAAIISRTSDLLCGILSVLNRVA